MLQDIVYDAPLFSTLNYNDLFTEVMEKLHEGLSDVNLIHESMCKSRVDRSEFCQNNRLIETLNKLPSNVSSLSYAVEMLSAKVQVSENEIIFLKEFDERLFGVNTTDEVLANMEDLDKMVQLSKSLSKKEKVRLRELVAILYHGIKYEQDNTLSRKDKYGCAAGILVTIGGAFTSNPLAVIAGGMIIDKYC